MAFSTIRQHNFFLIEVLRKFWDLQHAAKSTKRNYKEIFATGIIINIVGYVRDRMKVFCWSKRNCSGEKLDSS